MGINAPHRTIVKWQTLHVREVMGRRAHFVERCPQFFSVFEMRIVANKKADAEIKLNCHHKRKIIFTMHLMPHCGRSQNRRGPIWSKRDFSLL
jgi:hypothetical protein